MRIAALAGLACLLVVAAPPDTVVAPKKPRQTDGKADTKAAVSKAGAKPATPARKRRKTAAQRSKAAGTGAKTTSTRAKTTAKRGKNSRAKTAASWRSRQLSPTADRYKEIQSALVTRGYLKEAPSGVWSNESSEALRRFQQDQSLEPTGKLNSLSLIALGLGAKRGGPVATPVPAATAPRAPRVESPVPAPQTTAPTSLAPNPFGPDPASPAPANPTPPNPAAPNPTPPGPDPPKTQP